MSSETLPEEVTKQGFRRKIWDYMTKNELINFPLSVTNRIPNFKGAAEAARRLTELEVFKAAKVVKINPDKPQEPVRFLSLEADKGILVPIPRLKSGLFLYVAPVGNTKKEELKSIATRQGLQKHGTPIGLDSNIKVDLIVLGSVCVSQDGYRIGKGEGFADLEFAIMMRMGAVNENTTVITTVHDCQIINNLPPQLFKEHDVPVDIIVTPTQTIVVNPKLKKPVGIIWEILSQRRVRSMQILQELKVMEEKEGKVLVLKEVDSDTETRRYEKNNIKRMKNKKGSRSKREDTTSEITSEGEKDKNIAKSRLPRNRQNQKRKEDGDNNPVNEDKLEENNRDKSLRRKFFKPRARSHIDFSLKLSNIASDVRVRDLKNALLERGVRPSDITWRGQRGFCYIHFGKLKNENSPPNQPIQVDSIVANLQQLRIGESTTEGGNEFIIVEPAKPITRIEVTDVTAV